MLVNMMLSDIAKVCGGELLGNDCIVSDVKTDSRQDLINSLFVIRTSSFMSLFVVHNACFLTVTSI